jgi:hypothetical protein
LNKALAKATGRWVAWLNADEYYLPGGLANLLHEAERSGADVIYGDAIDVDHEGKMLRLRAQHPFSPLILRWYGTFPSVSFIVRREVLEHHPWDPGLRVVMDWDLFLGLLDKGAAFRLAILGAYRRHRIGTGGPGSGGTTVVRERYGHHTSCVPQDGDGAPSALQVGGANVRPAAAGEALPRNRPALVPGGCRKRAFRRVA